MYSRWFSIAVVVLWLGAMGWLVTQKVLPPLLVGEPPNYRTILAAQQDQPPVGWTMSLAGRQIGWALSTVCRTPDEMTEIRSRVHFDELPLQELASGWLRTLLEWAKQPDIKLQMDARSTLAIDPLGRLSRFESAVRLDPLKDVIKLRGVVDGSQLRLEVRAGGFSYATQRYLSSDALPDDALSPQTQLPGLRAGQTWTVPVYSPLRPPNNPLEILQAKVEGIERVSWDGRPVETWLVVYRSDPGLGLGAENVPRGRLWVRRDGTVLKQQVTLLDASMVFVRLPEDQAAALQKQLHDADNDARDILAE